MRYFHSKCNADAWLVTIVSARGVESKPQKHRGGFVRAQIVMCSVLSPLAKQSLEHLYQTYKTSTPTSRYDLVVLKVIKAALTKAEKG